MINDENRRYIIRKVNKKSKQTMLPLPLKTQEQNYLPKMEVDVVEGDGVIVVGKGEWKITNPRPQTDRKVRPKNDVESNEHEVVGDGGDADKPGIV